MNALKKWIILATAVFLMTNGTFYAALADDDEHENKRWHQKSFDRDDGDDEHEKKRKRKRYQKKSRNDSDHNKEEYLRPVNNKTYIEWCGACHFVYQPELLPAGSWNKILAGLKDHFGETIDLDQESKVVIREYLDSNSAEHLRAKRSVKIMKSLKSHTPVRITEVPYIRAKHRKIGQNILQRESIGSLSNCPVCHLNADKGIYEDDDVRIPK